MKKKSLMGLVICILCILMIVPLGIIGVVLFESRIPPGALSEGTITVNMVLANMEVVVLEINEDNIIVSPTSDIPKYSSMYPGYETDYSFLHTDKLQINLKEVDTVCALEVGKIVNILYNFRDGTEGFDPMLLKTVEKIEEVEDWENIVFYNGRSYHKRYLSKNTLKWLEMSEEERMEWDYYPTDLVRIGKMSLSNEVMEWSLIGRVDKVTPTGITVIFEQNDFIPTTLNDEWQFSTDGYFRIKKLEEQEWKSVNVLKDIITQKIINESCKVQNIEPNGETVLEFNWRWLYGSLSKGEYCLIQKIKVLKEEGSDWRTIWIPFTVE